MVCHPTMMTTGMSMPGEVFLLLQKGAISEEICHVPIVQRGCVTVRAELPSKIWAPQV